MLIPSQPIGQIVLRSQRLLARALPGVGIEQVMEPSFTRTSTAALTCCAKVALTFRKWGEEERARQFAQDGWPPERMTDRHICHHLKILYPVTRGHSMATGCQTDGNRLCVSNHALLLCWKLFFNRKTLGEVEAKCPERDVKPRDKMYTRHI